MEKSPNQQHENLNEQENPSQILANEKSFEEHMAEMKQLEGKDVELEKRNAGVYEKDSGITPSYIDEEANPPITKEQYESLLAQQQADAEKARQEAERVAKEQAEAEEAAKKEAETRKFASEEDIEEIQKANEAAERVEKEMAQEQAKANETAKRAMEEQWERDIAQAEANAEYWKDNNWQANKHANDTAAKRARLFENGDF